jgi:hypothetical protein
MKTNSNSTASPADTGALPPSKSVFVFGRRILYYDVGSGSTVVLLHGFGSQAMYDWGV